MNSIRQPIIADQATLFDQDTAYSSFKDGVSSTFADNLSLPVHRWFRYSAGFSAAWARDVILREQANGRTTLLDPFAGSGTVLLEGEACGIEAVGVEAHPFIAQVAQTKLYWRTNPQAFSEYAYAVLAQAQARTGDGSRYAPLVTKCFPAETLTRLDKLRRSIQATADGSAAAALAWLALASILRACSPVGTAQWQYILPNKSKSNVADPYEAFASKVSLMANDMVLRQAPAFGPPARLHWEDARQCPSVPDAWADLIITSPPYANNYDYADATRLEMSFFGDIQHWGDLQESVRKYLIRSCTQHVAKQQRETQTLLDASALHPIRSEIEQVCQSLARERLEHGGKKPYHTMIAAYFQDMAHTWCALRRVAKDGALVCLVIGDSAPYGIHVPVDEWLGELALAAGFKSYKFEKTRDRNTKWKNRKHRIPLHEGRLWVEG